MSPVYETWDVVTVPFPFTEGDAAKRRPALVVSSEHLARTHGLYWVVMITSAKNSGWADDVAVKDLERAGLPAPSVVRPAKIATLQTDRVFSRLGTLQDSGARKAVAAAVKRFMAV